MKNKILGGMLLVLASTAIAGADETSQTTVNEKQSDRKAFQIGVMGGGSMNAQAGPFSTGASLGAHVEYKPASYLGVGFFGTYTNFQDAQLFFIDTNLQQTILAGELKVYPFANDGLYLGGRVGAALTTAQVSAFGVTTSSSQTDLVVGGDIGFNIKLGQSFSLAPEVSYMTLPAQSSNVVNVMMNLNFWM